LLSHLLVIAFLLLNSSFASHPSYATTAEELCPSGVDPCVVSSVVVVTDGSVIDLAGRIFIIEAGGRLDVGSGRMALGASTIHIQSGGEVRARGGTTRGGSVFLTARSITVEGTIRASGSSGGEVFLVAEEDVLVDASITAEGTAETGSVGTIEITGRDLIVSADLLATGGIESVGGALTLSGAGDVTIASQLDVVGGLAGGQVLISAGEGFGGNLDVLFAGRIAADGVAGGGLGGTISLTADGDGDLTGNISMNGFISATGPGTVQIGGDGGCITLEAVGDIEDSSLARYDVSGGSPDGFGGAVEFTAGDSVSLRGRVFARGRGNRGFGGDVTVDAARRVLITGMLSVTGPGRGGTADLFVEEGQIEIASVALVEASGSLGGAGGSVSLDASFLNSTALILGRIVSDGGSSTPTSGPGSGGTIQIDTDGELNLRGRIEALGGNGGGRGGTVALTSSSGSVRIEGTASTRGQGDFSEGGVIAVSSGDLLSVSGRIDASGMGVGGRVALDAVGGMLLGGQINATGSLTGGSIVMTGQADVAVAGSVVTNGGAGPGDLGGQISVEGCGISVQERATLSALGNNGRNRIIGRNGTTISGSLAANAQTGSNEIVFRVVPPEIRPTASIVPPETLIMDESLTPCPVCGNTIIEPPETCDDGGVCVGGLDDGVACVVPDSCREGTCTPMSGDGCSFRCRLEGSPPGDTNCDLVVDSDDLRALTMELFDGDGDTVGSVQFGTFPACAGADANGDGFVTSADIVATIKIIGTP
jgi:hypothetical protein